MSSAVEICLAQEAKLKDTQVKENAVRFNPTTYQFERWTGSAWVAIGSNIDESNLVHRTGNETISGTKTFNNTIVGSVNGNSGTSTKLKNARSINVTDGTNNGTSASFDGSEDVSIKLPSTIKATLTGNATSATKLVTARTIQTNLASTSTDSFDGTANVTPGVTGILPVANGGTGNSTGKAPSAVIADSATTAESALKDGVGNVIADTYARADDLPKAGLPLGHIYLWPFTTPPDGSIQVNGSTYNRELYSDLWSLIQTKGWYKSESEWQSIASANGGYCPWYSSGDGSTTFRVPKFAPYQKLALASGAGKYYEAGLPNITGVDTLAWSLENDGLITNGGTVSGAFKGAKIHRNVAKVSRAQPIQINENVPYGVGFDASLSNAVYGNSTTVQPESHGWIVCVVAFGTATNVGSVDVANVMSAIGQVQAIPHIVETWVASNSTCWYRKWSDGWLEQGGRIVVNSSAAAGYAYHAVRLTYPTPFTRLLRWQCQARHDCFIAGFNTEGAELSSVEVYQKNTQPPNLTNPFVIWYACGY